MPSAASHRKLTLPIRKEPGPQSFADVVRLVRGICRLAGLPSLIDEIRSDGEPSLGAIIEAQDTTALFDWLIVVLSYQGISDRVASAYIEGHGSVTWAEIEKALAQDPSCPKLRSYWHFNGCGYRKARGSCSRADHYDRCPLPKHRLRNGRLNQTAYSLFLFIRDVTESDLVNWIDDRLADKTSGLKGKRLAATREALIGPLRNVYGVADKVLNLAFASMLLAADEERPHWRELGGTMIAIDTLVHNFLKRTGVLRALSADHPYGEGCYGPNGCAKIIERISKRVDAREFNRTFPAYFPRFVQYAIWRYCAQEALDSCNGNRIASGKRCRNDWCRLYGKCARRRIPT
jgi:hypothetical protein